MKGPWRDTEFGDEGGLHGGGEPERAESASGCW